MKSRHFVLLCSALLLPSSLVGQDVMWQPTSITSNMGEFGGSFLLTQLIDQVGLTTSYISGVTPAASYNSTHNNVFDEWQSAGIPTAS